MNVRIVALTAALLPFFAVHLSYLLAASHDLVAWCVPYWQSCTSISATGRSPPASYLFRGTMLPAAIILMAYWWLSYAWLRAVRQMAALPPGGALRWMLVLGIGAGLGLILYVTVLGEVGDRWARQRRTGVILFFSFTYIAQLLCAAQLRQLQLHLPRVQGLARAMLWLCLLLLLLGVSTVLLDAWDPTHYATIDDAFEWNLSLLLQLNFLLGYFVWRRAGWSLRVIHA